MAWTLHRLIDLTALDADPLDPATPDPTVVNWVQTTKGTQILWVAVPMDGLDLTSSVPVAPAGLTVDGSLVLRWQMDGAQRRSRYPLLSETGGQQPAGLMVEDGPLPSNGGVGQAYVHIPAVTNPGVIPAVWIYYHVAADGEGS